MQLRSMKVISCDELKTMLNLHEKWLNNEVCGVRANFKDLFLPKVNFENANLSEANFENTYFSESNFKHANLSKANFKHADLSKANFSYSNLEGADLCNANLKYIDLEYANLKNTNMYNTNLKHANLHNANIHNTNLAYSNFSFALILKDDFRKLNLKGVTTNNKYIQISCLGPRKDTLTYCIAEDIVLCGYKKYYNGETLNKFEKRIKSTYDKYEDAQYYNEYMGAIRYFRTFKKIKISKLRSIIESILKQLS